MNDMNDGPARDSNPQPLAYQANALPTEQLGLAEEDLRKLSGSDSKRQRLEGRERHCMSETLEEKLMEWIEQQRSLKLRVSRKMVSRKAVDIFKEDPEVQ